MGVKVSWNNQLDSQKEIISINPSTEEELGRVRAISRPAIDEIFKKACDSYHLWSRKSVKERVKYFKNLFHLIFDQVDEIANLIALEQGKTTTEAKLAEILPVLAIIKDLRKNARKILSNAPAKHELILFSHKKSKYRFVPYGVVVIISPWNFPFSVPIPEIVAAIIAGNTVVFKPAPGAVLIGKKIDELFRQAGFPDGVVNTIFITDENADYLVAHECVDKVVFTGSTKTGQKVMCNAAKQVSSILLELGGKDPAIVAADADITRAAKGIVWGAFFNAGQVCASIERVYVERPVAEKFIQACIDETKKLKVGNPLDENIDIGPLENERQLKVAIGQVKEATIKGAKVEYGGERAGNKGYFFQPTILTEVDHSMMVMTEETFGPVLPIMVVGSVEEAIRLANDSDYGLSAYGWTSNPDTAEKLQQELEAGTVMINDATASWGEPNAPWGGFKKSGIGRTRSQFGLMEMVQVKYTCYDKGKNKYNLWWFPYDRSADEIGNLSIKLLFSKNWTGKIRPLFRLLTLKRFVKTVHWIPILKNLRKLF